MSHLHNTVNVNRTAHFIVTLMKNVTANLLVELMIFNYKQVFIKAVAKMAK